jgi:hypothetical protein
MHLNNSRHQAGLAFLPALILFVIVIIIAGLMLSILLKTCRKLLPTDPPYNGPNTNTPIDSTFISWDTNLMSVASGDPTLITPEQLAELLVAADGELKVLVLRSTNLIHWTQILETNTVNHQVLYEDPERPYPVAFYKTLIVVP